MARRSKSSRHKAYPHRGTPAGDQTLGTCDGKDCGREVKRGDPFVVTANGLLACRPCWEKPDTFGDILPSEKGGQPEPDEIVVTDDYGPDNPFF